MERKHIVLCLIAVVAAAWMAAGPAEGGQMDLVQNGDFAQVADGEPVGWAASGDPAYVAQELAAAYDAGNPCARLTCT